MKVTYYLMVFAVSIFAANAATGANLIVNGDFEQGNTGFNTGYGYSSTGFPEGTYAIDTNPSNLGGGWASYNDHTTGAGNMMIANGVVASIVIPIWEQTVLVSPDTSYEFSFWASTANSGVPSNPAELEYFINDVPLGTISPPEQYGVWIQASTLWYSGTDTTATIKIADIRMDWQGNDFALDDISFVPEPATLLLFGMGGFSLLRRKR